MEKITVRTTIDAPIEKVWKTFTSPRHIMKWNFASDNWHTTKAENDLKSGGRFSSRMEAKDGSSGFDFTGTYDQIVPNELIRYTLDDNRKVSVSFSKNDSRTIVIETFDADETHSVEIQQQGWQSILDNFKVYVENLSKSDRLHYEILIDAAASKVYQTLLAEDTYRTWTAAFHPTSFFEGSWEKGSKMYFIGTDENGRRSGMISIVEENIPDRFLGLRNIGMLNDNTEITSGPEVDSWIGGIENYTLTQENGQTRLTIDVDVNREYKDEMNDCWPKALEIIKKLSEA